MRRKDWDGLQTPRGAEGTAALLHWRNGLIFLGNRCSPPLTLKDFVALGAGLSPPKVRTDVAFPVVPLPEGPGGVLGVRIGVGWRWLKPGARWLCPCHPCHSPWVCDTSHGLAGESQLHPRPGKDAGGKEESKREAGTSHTLT